MGPVLLHRGLDDVGREAVPDEIHQGVLGGDVLLLMIPLLHWILLAATEAVSWPDGDHQDDAEDDCQDGGGDVVEDCAESNLPGERKIHGSYKYQILVHLDGNKTAV